jgi:hypothetical protein
MLLAALGDDLPTKGDVDLASLATTAGATAATLIIVQVVKQIAKLSAKGTRMLALFLAIGLLMTAQLIITLTGDAELGGAAWAGLIFVSLINGCVAGLAAMKTYETVAHKGLGHGVTDASG